MKRFFACLSAFLFAIAPLSPSAQATTINFDDVADGIDISGHYPGLTFSCDGAACNPLNGPVYARVLPTTASPPNSVATFTTGIAAGVADNTTGRVKVVVGTPVRTVSVDARSVGKAGFGLTPTQHAILIAQDMNGAPIGQAAGSVYGTFESLSVSAPSNQIAIVFLGVDGGQHQNAAGLEAVAQFDNLRFDSDSSSNIFPVAFKWWQGLLLALVVLIVAGGMILRGRRSN